MTSDTHTRTFEFSAARSQHPARVPLDQIQLAATVIPTIGPETVQSVHPWGFIVPGEVVAYDATILATIQAHWVPVGTTFIVRLVPEDGSTPYEARVLHVGPNPVEYIKLPNEWLAPFIGRTVYLGYEAEWADGTRTEGPGLEFQITPLLEIPPIRFDGLQGDEPLDPEKFPDGLVATLDPVPQVREYHRAALFFTVLGTRDGFISNLMVRGYTLEGLKDHAVSVTIDPAAYSGHYEEGYTDVYAVATLRMIMIPRPNPHGIEAFAVGRLDVLPPAT